MPSPLISLQKKEGAVVAVLEVILEGCYTAAELVGLGRYNRFSRVINDELFPIKRHEPRPRTIELIEFNYDPTFEEVLEVFSSRGLERPIFEDALYFGVQQPEWQRTHSTIFPHELVRVGSYRGLLMLHGDDEDYRALDLWWLDGDKELYQYFLYAGVRKSA